MATTTSTTSSTSATSAISGLVSGLDTDSIVTKLMAIESQPKTLLQNQLSTVKSKASALQALNSSMSSLATAAKALSTADDWKPTKATSSSTGVAVSALGNANLGDVDVTVNSVAKAQKNSFSTAVALTANASGASTSIKLTVGGTTKTLDTGDGSLQGVVNALNTSGTGVKASTVKLDDGTYRLTVASSSTGTAGAFTLTAEDGSDLLGGSTVTAATNASVTVNGDTVTSSTNTFNDVVSGLSFTVSAAAVGTTATLSATLDSDSMASSVKNVVDGINSALSTFDTLTAASSSSSGLFAGDVSLNSIRDQLLNTVFGSDYASTMSKYGIETNSSGTLDFNTSTFTAAYQADPDGTAKAFAGDSAGSGFFDKVYSIANGASNSTDGLVTSMVTSQNSTISDLNDRISNWTTRLEAIQKTMESKFTAMETLMSSLNSTSSWLTSQITAMEGSKSS